MSMVINAESLEPSKNIQTACRSLGQEKEPLIVVDSFLANIDALRAYAIEKNNFTDSDSYYPGIRMPVPLLYTAALAKNFSAHIQGYFGLNLQAVKKAVSSYSIVTKSPSDLSLMQRLPHIDAPTKNSLAMIHYLCDSPASGTAFYRDCETGFEYIDEQRHHHYMERVKKRYADSCEYPQGYIYHSTDDYEVIESLAAKQNRLLIYRGSSLHSGVISPEYNFDPSPISGRLTIATFIEFK